MISNFIDTDTCFLSGIVNYTKNVIQLIKKEMTNTDLRQFTEKLGMRIELL